MATSPIRADLEVAAVRSGWLLAAGVAVRLRDGDRPVASGRITGMAVDTAGYLHGAPAPTSAQPGE
jgi:hypothetical protein